MIFLDRNVENNFSWNDILTGTVKHNTDMQAYRQDNTNDTDDMHFYYKSNLIYFLYIYKVFTLDIIYGIYENPINSYTVYCKENI